MQLESLKEFKVLNLYMERSIYYIYLNEMHVWYEIFGIRDSQRMFVMRCFQTFNFVNTCEWCKEGISNFYNVISILKNLDI